MEADTERIRQEKQLESIQKEKAQLKSQVLMDDICHLKPMQLVHRNDQLKLEYEKTRLQQSTLGKGETMYSQRIDDINLLKAEIKKMRREKATMERNVANIDNLKREMFQVQRELMRERMRCRALEQELETPMNVHRWRKLEGRCVLDIQQPLWHLTYSNLWLLHAIFKPDT